MVLTLCEEGEIDFDDLAVKPENGLEVGVGDIARKAVDDDDFLHFLVVGGLHVDVCIVERLWGRRATSVRHG